jgi:hypothetical protein
MIDHGCHLTRIGVNANAGQRIIPYDRIFDEQVTRAVFGESAGWIEIDAAPAPPADHAILNVQRTTTVESDSVTNLLSVQRQSAQDDYVIRPCVDSDTVAVRCSYADTCINAFGRVNGDGAIYLHRAVIARIEHDHLAITARYRRNRPRQSPARRVALARVAVVPARGNVCLYSLGACHRAESKGDDEEQDVRIEVELAHNKPPC